MAQHTINSRTSNNANINKKLAPKAIIDDDGDIEVMENKKTYSNFYREPASLQRSSMRLSSEGPNNWLQRNASERLSHRVIPTHQYRNSQHEAPTGNYQSIQGFQCSAQHQPFSKHHQQNQLAAAAAAAAAVSFHNF